MAAPVDSARQGTNITTAATSHAINVGSPASGTLLIVLVRYAGAPGTVTFTGYTTLVPSSGDDASDDVTSIYYRLADGTEGATDTLTTSNSIKLAAICWEITGAMSPATEVPSTSFVTVGTAANIDPSEAPKVKVDFTGQTETATSPVQGDGDALFERFAQSFTVLPSCTTITEVGLVVKKEGSPTDDLIIEIQSNSGSAPSGTVIGTVATVNGTSLSTTSALQTFSGLSIAVTAGTAYSVVVRRSGSVDATNRYLVARGGDVYADGSGRRRGGASWVAVTGDALFSTRFSGLPSREYLFLTVIGMDHETATATAPSGYANTASANSGTGGAVATNCQIWGASKSATATHDDPAAWTSSAPTNGVTAWTIAIVSSTPSAAGSCSLAITAGFTTDGQGDAKGATLTPAAATIATVAKTGAFGSTAMPIAATFAVAGTAGVAGAFGATSLTINSGVATVGRGGARGLAALSSSVGIQTAGAAGARGSTATSITAAFTTLGRAGARGATASSASAAFAVVGHGGAQSSATLAATLTFTTDGLYEPPVSGSSVHLHVASSITSDGQGDAFAATTTPIQSTISVAGLTATYSTSTLPILCVFSVFIAPTVFDPATGGSIVPPRGAGHLTHVGAGGIPEAAGAGILTPDEGGVT